MIRIAVITSLLHSRHGGPATAVKTQIEALTKFADIKLFAICEPSEKKELQAQWPSARLFDIHWPRRWFYAEGFYQSLKNDSKNIDIFHAHMLWDYPVLAAAQVAAESHKPLVITPHGSLSEPWRRNQFHKKIYQRLFLKKIVRSRTTFQVLNSAEDKACNLWDSQCKTEIIPNGLSDISFKMKKSPTKAISQWPWMKNQKIALYLGRIWKEKGLDILPEAWKLANEKSDLRGWKLVLAGPDYRGYQRSLTDRISKLGLDNDIKLIGSVKDDLKWSLLSKSTFFILPSHGEGFSMSLLEAMASRKPCLITEPCHLPEMNNLGGLSVKDKLEPLAEGLRYFASLPTKTLNKLGNQGWKLAFNRYRLSVLSERYISLYRRLLS